MSRRPCKRWLGFLAFLSCLTLSAPAFAPDPPLQALAPFEVVLDGLKSPQYLAVDPSNILLLSEAGPGQILQIAPDRKVTVVIDQLEDPEGIVIDPASTVFVAAERQRGTEGKGQKGVILRRDPKTQALSMVASEFKHPQGLTLDPHGTLFVSAKGRQGERDEKGALYSIDSSGGISLLANGFKQPQGVAVSLDGSLLVAAERFERGNATVEGSLFRVDPTGHVTALIPRRLNDPFGVARDPLDSFYVAGTSPGEGDSEHGVILKRRPDGQVVTFAQGLRKPRGLAFDGTGNLYAVEAGHKRVLKFIAPTPPKLDPAPPAFTNKATVLLQGTTEPGALLTVQGGSAPVTVFADAAGAFSLTVPLAKNTANALLLFATASAGDGLTSAPTTISIVHDDLPPAVSITNPTVGALLRGTIPFTATATDSSGISLVTLKVDATTLVATNVSPFTTSLDTKSLTDGAHTVSAIARDKAGNEAQAAVSITVDNTPPTLVITAPADGSTVPTPTPTLSLAYSDATSGVSLSTFHATLDGTDITAAFTLSPTGATATLPTSLANGPHTLQASISDQAGNAATAASAFTVSTGPDFTLQVAPAHGQVLQGASVIYTVELQSQGSAPFTGLATLAVAGLPAGVIATFSPPILSGGQRATLTVTAEVGAPLGSSTLTLSATAPAKTGFLTRSVAGTLTVQAGGRTALVGQFTLIDGTPLQGIRLTLASQTTATDAGGNFQFPDLPAGLQTLSIDATPVGPTFPIYGVDVTLRAGQATQLSPFRLVPPPPPARFTRIDNATHDQLITDPRYPGVALTLPAGVSIVGWDGQLKTQMSIERLTLDRLPVPPPPGPTRSLYQIFWGTPMGGLPSAPLPVTLPNDLDLAPGEKAELWYYDAAPFIGVPASWRLAGLGTVSPDGSRIVSDPGVGLARFCGVCGLSCFIPRQAAQPNRNPDGPRAGDPVDLALGQFIVEKTDLILPGRLPAVVHRIYNPFDPFGKIAGFELGLGPGWSLSVDVVLQEESPTLRRLILPGNARFAFLQQSDGSFRNTSHPRWAGAVLTQSGTTHALRLKDGTIWRFSSGWLPRGRARPIAGLGLLVEQQDRAGNRLTIARDQHGGMTHLTEPGGRMLTVTITVLNPGGVARVSEIADPLGRIVRYTYDQASRLETVTDPAGGVTRYTYDQAGGILSITDPRGIPFLTNEYDPQGRVMRQIQADGGIWSFTYAGPVGLPTQVTVTDPRGSVTTHRFAPTGFVRETVDALGQPTTFERAPGTNLLLSTTDSLGRVTRFTNDANGNVTSITDPQGHIRTFTYEPTFNRLTTLTDPLGNLTQFSYDAQGNLVTISDPLGATTLLAYNAAGQPVSTTDPMGNVTRFDYDAFGNLMTLTDPLGNHSSRTYDLVSRLLTQTDPRGKVTSFAYDPLNRLTQLVDALSGVTRFTYDGNGNLLTVTDARGHTLTHSYDSMDRLSRRLDPLVAAETFAYDQVGNLTSTTDRKGQTTTFSYDALNRQTRATYADGAIATFTYDAAGRLVQADDTADPHRPITLAYDTLDRLVNETTALGTVAYQYDPLGRRTQMAVNDLSPVTYTYDAASRLRRITQAPLNPVSIDYDAVGRRTKLTLPNGVSTESQYDAASRLAALIYRNATGLLGDLTYTYDAAGNRTGVGGSFARTLPPDPIASATYDPANRQLTFGGKAMTYDANGNLASITEPSVTTTFTWDARNRLSALSGPGVSASFAYDALGRRATKQIAGSPTKFLYDGLDIVQERQGGTAIPYLRSLTLDEPWVRNGTDFYLADALGSILGLTDTTGTLATRYSYEPFGGTVLEGVASSNPFAFTAREQDGMSGIYYYRARYYHPGLQRFMSEDPIGLLGGDTNLYAYVLNNPLRFNDPSGELLPQLAIGAGIGAFGGGLNALLNNQPVLAGAERGAIVGVLASLGPRPAQVVTNVLGNIVSQVNSGTPLSDLNLTSVAATAVASAIGKDLAAVLVNKEVPGLLAQGATGLVLTPISSLSSFLLKEALPLRLSDLFGQSLGGRK